MPKIWPPAKVNPMFPQKFFLLVFFSLSLFFSCKNEVAQPNSPVPAKAEKTPKAQPISNSAVTSPIGQRSADEMVAAGFKRYGLEKGVLLFRIDGAMKGMEAIYFDHWGWREGRHKLTETEVGAYHDKDRSVQYLDGERRYQYETEENTAYFFESTQVQAAADKHGTKNMVLVTDEMLKDMGGERVGEAEVEGVMCDIWKVEKTKSTFYMWQGITMKEHSFTSNIPVTRRCVSLDTTKVVDLAKMTLPEGAKLENVGLQ